MARAEIIIQQSPHAPSTAGQSQRGLDLYVTNSEAVNFSNSTDGDSGVGTWEWTLIERPPGSTATMLTPSSATASIQPDVYGRYVISLRVNGMGDDTPGYSRAVVGVSCPSQGQDGQGNEVGDWDFPAFHEGTDANWEDQYNPINPFGAQSEIYRILNQIRFNGSQLLGLAQDIAFAFPMSGALIQRSNEATPAWADAGYTHAIDVGQFTFTDAKFSAVVMREGTAGTVKVRMYDVTHTAPVTGTELTTTSTSAVSLLTSALTVGSSAGNIRNDEGTIYKVQIAIDGGSPTDYAWLLGSSLLLNA